MKVGDILYANLGCTMGIPTWYKVTKVTKSTAWFRVLKSHSISDDGYGQNGEAMPNVNEFEDREPEMKARIKQCIYPWGSYEAVKVGYNKHATLWDGEPKMYYTD